MKTLKVLIGVVLALFSTITIFEMFSEESGAGLFGAISGYVLIMAIAVWLIYSALKDDKINITNADTKVNYKSDETFHNLSDLKQKGILTDEEYSQKVSKINADKNEQELKNSVEYKQLKSLLDSGVLTKEEFESKIKLLKIKPSDIKENTLKKYDIVGLYKNSNSTFVFNATGGYSIEASSLKEKGKWKIDAGRIVLTTKTTIEYIEVLSATSKNLDIAFKGKIYNLIKR